MGVLSRAAVEAMGFASLGQNVQISDKASFYGVNRITLGNNVRIDNFCVLSAGIGGISVGNYIQISVYSSLLGAGQITLSDFCNISSRVAIYSSNDDYSGATMTNPAVPSEYTGVTHADVFFCKHVILGSSSIILPGVTLDVGAAVGALSLVNGNCKAFGIYAGHPARRIQDRKCDLLALQQRFMASLAP